MKHSLLCPDCERLEREYQLTIVEIYSVVGGRFNTVGEKVRELFRWQDVRDKAVRWQIQASQISYSLYSESRQLLFGNFPDPR